MFPESQEILSKGIWGPRWQMTETDEGICVRGHALMQHQFEGHWFRICGIFKLGLQTDGEGWWSAWSRAGGVFNTHMLDMERSHGHLSSLWPYHATLSSGGVYMLCRNTTDFSNGPQNTGILEWRPHFVAPQCFCNIFRNILASILRFNTNLDCCHNFLSSAQTYLDDFLLDSCVLCMRNPTERLGIDFPSFRICS